MKKIYLIFPILFLLLSCENKDLVVQKSKKNCSCSNIIEQSYIKEVDNYMRNHSSYTGPGSFDCNPPFLQPQNVAIFAQSSTLELKNNSQTKVYQVLIQINENGKIKYQKYNIEPTEVVELGCDSKFNVSFTYNYSEDPFEALKLSYLSKAKILYKIHEIKVLSEY